MSASPALSYAAQLVQSQDRERFVSALFAPASRREDLMVLYAFYAEIARIRSSVREAMAGMIRLQWWREVLSGQRVEEAARHPIAADLIRLQQVHRLPYSLFDEILLAREWELTCNGFTDMDHAAKYGSQTAGSLIQLALWVLRPDQSDVAEPILNRAAQIGAGASLIGLARSLPHHLSVGWNMIPQAFAHLDNSPESLKTIAAAFGEAGLAALQPAAVPRWAVPALAAAAQARAHGRMMQKLGWNVLDMRVSLPRSAVPAILWAMLQGRM